MSPFRRAEFRHFISQGPNINGQDINIEVKAPGDITNKSSYTSFVCVAVAMLLIKLSVSDL